MIQELVKQLNELKPGKGLLVVGNTKIDYNITDHGYSIRMISGSDFDVDKKKAEDSNKADEAAKQRALTIKKEIDERVKAFKAEMEQISDDVFQEACEMFNKNNQYFLNDLSKAFDKAVDLPFIKSGIDTFRRAVNQVLENKIDFFKQLMLKV